ncbi:hypothetical protein Droror1_Dr00004747 [Drosera rotundifolia]
MADREDDDSDAPEEFTSEQGKLRDEEIIKVQRENKARVIRERKERRRKLAQKLTPRAKPVEEPVENEKKAETQKDEGMLPQDIVNLLAAKEKKVFSSDNEEDNKEKEQKPKKKRVKKLGDGLIILNDIRPPPCLQSSLDFLKKRNMQVARSSAVLNNPKQALRLLSTTGILK